MKQNLISAFRDFFKISLPTTDKAINSLNVTLKIISKHIQTKFKLSWSLSNHSLRNERNFVIIIIIIITIIIIDFYIALNLKL